MAAPWVVQVHRLALGRTVVNRLPCTCSTWYQRTQEKGTKRFVTPPVGKEKQKWFRRPAVTETKERKVTKKMLAFQMRQPTDDVWLRYCYPRPTYSFVDSITMHRELASPEMTDDMNAYVYLDLVLDMTTKKKTKFLSDFTHTLVLPHYFDDGTVNRILAFCRTPEDRQMAEEMGATFVGGMDLIKNMQKGEIHHEEYEHVICTLDLLADVTSVRKHLRHLFPNKHKGSLGTDVEEMMTQFSRGKTFSSTKTSDATAKVKVTIGTLDMSPEQLSENFDHYITTVSSHRSPSLGPFITSGIVTCPPSTEVFKLSARDLLPPSLRFKPVEGETGDAKGGEESDGEEDEEEEGVAMKQ